MFNHSPATTFSVYPTRANRRAAAVATVDDAHFTPPVHIHIYYIYANLIGFQIGKKLGKRTPNKRFFFIVCTRHQQILVLKT